MAVRNEQNMAGGVVGGAASGAAAGTWYSPVWEQSSAVSSAELLEASIGIALDDCIIVTCCHGRHSEQVDIAREYRTGSCRTAQIRGYYALADKVVPAASPVTASYALW